MCKKDYLDILPLKGEMPVGSGVKNHAIIKILLTKFIFFILTWEIVVHPYKMNKYLLNLITCIGCIWPTSTFGQSLYSVDKTRGEWTLMIIPDTQGYAEDWTEEGYNYSEMVETFDWIGEVRDILNIKVVQSVGDMVENNNDVEWNRVVDVYYPLLKMGIPTIPCAGNHEWKHGGGNGDYSFMNKYFPLSMFENKPWWGGNFPENEIQNSYQNFTISGQEYLFLTLEFNAGSKVVGAQAAVDWAEEIIKANPDKIVILSSHWNKGEVHFAQLADVYPNVKMTLAGHRCTEEYYITKERCHNFVQDYQCQGISKGSGGLMEVRYFVFKPMDDKVEWYTYSAVVNNGEGAFINRNEHSQGSFELLQDDP